MLSSTCIHIHKHTHTKWQLLHIINVLIIHNYLIMKASTEVDRLRSALSGVLTWIGGLDVKFSTLLGELMGLGRERGVLANVLVILQL